MTSTPSIGTLQQKLGYHFHNPTLLTEALRHPSIKQQDRIPSDYERLEFLGDAVLGFVITQHIFTRFQNYDEGQLAKMRAFLVCKDTICDVAESLNLEEYILMGSGEERCGGRTNPNNIENSMEALIAAIYLDGGFEVVESLILRLWDNFIAEDHYIIADPKSSLQEWSQSQSYKLPHYDVIAKTGQDHSPIFEVTVLIEGFDPEYGRGKTIKTAEKMAARSFLRKVFSDLM